MPTAVATLAAAVLLAVVVARLALARRQLVHLRAHRGQVPAAFRPAIASPDQARAADYQQARLRLGMVETCAGAVLFAAMSWGGGVAWLVAVSSRLPGPAWLTGVAPLMALVGLLGVVRLPFAAWTTFRIESRFGFNRSTPALFAADAVRQAAVGGVLWALLGGALLALMAAGWAWWLWAWGVWLGFSMALTWAYPKWIAPLFNRFRPLEDPELRQRIASLLKHCGFRLGGVFVMDASRRTAHGNAYFTGLGSAKRVVFFDTLLDSLAPAETEAVLAHELGHFRLGHIRTGLAVSALAAFAGLACLGFLRTQPAFFQGLGVAAPSDPAALMLFLLAGPWVAFPWQPLAAAWSRRREFQADRFAAEASDSTALGRALVKLYRDNASALTADPWYARVYHSHPAPAERLARLQAAA